MERIRRHFIKLISLLGLGILIFLAESALAIERDFPNKAITVHVGMPPGGTTSITANILVQGVQKYLPKHQPVVINHKPGAAGIVCADYWIKLPADGYNLLLIASDTPMSMARESQKLSFSLKDFSCIMTPCYSPRVLAVRNESPFKTIEDFIEYAKKHPREITVSTSGLGSGGHLTLELFMRDAGIQVIHVPFEGGGPANLAMLGGHVTSAFLAPATLGPHIKPGGGARALAVFDNKRLTDFPDIPLYQGTKYDVISIGQSYNTLIVKQGTPKPVFEAIVNIFKQTASDPLVESALIKAGFIPKYLGPKESEMKISRDYDMASKIFSELGLVGK